MYLGTLLDNLTESTLTQYLTMHVSISDHIRHLIFDLLRSLKVKCDGDFGHPIYHVLSVFNSNIWPNSAALQNISLWNPNDLATDLSRSFKVKCDSVIGLPIYAFLLRLNSNIWPNSAPLQDTKLRNLSDLTLTFQCHSRSNVMVSFDSIYGFLLIYISNCMPISHRLAVIGTQNVFSYLGPNSKNRKCTEWPQDEWIQGQWYPIHVEVLPTSPFSIYMFTATPWLPNFSPIFSIDTRFPVTGHFETSAPNDPKMTLNTNRSKIPI